MEETSLRSPGRAAQISTRVLKYAISATVLSLVVCAIGVNLRIYYIANWCVIAMLISLSAGLMAGIVRVSSSIFAETQLRMGELLITLMAAGIFAAVANIYFDPIYPREKRHVLPAVVAFAVFVMTGIGSAWAWSAASAFKLEHPLPRLKLMFTGWLLVSGTIALVIVGLFVVFFAINGINSDLNAILLYAAPLSLLTIPGVLVELRRRQGRAQKREQEYTQPPQRFLW